MTTLDEYKAEERIALDRLSFARKTLVQLIHDAEHPIGDIVAAMNCASIGYVSAYLAWHNAIGALNAAHRREREVTRASEAAPRKEEA